MTLDETLKLIEAGYTKAEIDAMAGAKAPEPKAEPKAEPKNDDTIVLSKEQFNKLMVSNTQPEAKTEPNKEVTNEDTKVSMTDEQFEKLLQGLRANGANIDVPEKVNIDDKLASHFASLFGASSNN